MMNIFGKLNSAAFIHEGAIENLAGLSVLGGVIAGLLLVTYLGRWKWIWNNWLTAVDHKKIGIMYLILAGVMLFRGFTDAAMMRTQQAIAASVPGYLTPDHFDQIFTAHGVIMIFFVAMPFMFGLLNLVVPIQIGARDVAFPLVNSIAFWLTAAAAMLVNLSLLVGHFAATGWLAYPPLSELKYSPGVGVDYYIWALMISGLGTTLGAINILVTIITMRTKGMNWMRLPIFTWTAFSSMVMTVFAFPFLTACLFMLALDRYLGFHFFTMDGGGDPMIYVNLIWAWGHPEVYILALPAFGIFSEVTSVFSQKRLFGYTSMVVATLVITFLSMLVWVHHFFTMGAGADVNAFFGVMTMLIGVPTGVKVFNWLFTMFRGRIKFDTPMLWVMGFLTTFTIGGATGVMLAVPAVDFQLHNSLFLVAHFHNMIISGVLFGYFSGLAYWFPKFFGFKLDEKWGKRAFHCWIIGFLTAFMPLYALGAMGATRRMAHYDASTGWQGLFILAGIGAGIIALGVLMQVIQIVVSIKNRKKLIAGDDPWNSGRTLEWAISSPPPHFNFARLPHVYERDAYFDMKNPKETKEYQSKDFWQDASDIVMPNNRSAGFIIAGFTFLMGFALVWHMWLIALLGLTGVIITTIIATWPSDKTHVIAKDKLNHHAV